MKMKKSCRNCIHGYEGICHKVQYPYASEIYNEGICQYWKGNKKIRFHLWLRQLGRDIAEGLKEINA